MISSFLLLILGEVSLASQMSRQGSKKVVEQQTINKVEEQNINQEQLDWALDQLPHHRTKRCRKHDFCGPQNSMLPGFSF